MERNNAIISRICDSLYIFIKFHPSIETKSQNENKKKIQSVLNFKKTMI